MWATPVCSEQYLKLASPYSLMQGRRINLWLVVAWLDLANAYGGVAHSLIDFTLHHYHAPSHFCNIVASLYPELSASITTTWTTPSSSLSIGVYQGDPLSGIIFNTEIKTLIATLKLRKDLDSSIPPSHPVPAIQSSRLLYTTISPSACNTEI